MKKFLLALVGLSLITAYYSETEVVVQEIAETKEVKKVEVDTRPISTERVDYIMKSMMSEDPKMLGFGIDGDSLIIKIDGSVYKGYNAYLTSVSQGRQIDSGISNAFEYYGYSEQYILDELDWEHGLFGLQSGIKRIKFSTNVDISKYQNG